jgi:5'-3' exonuclease
VVAWDLGIPLFRRELFRGYKPFKVPIGSVHKSLLSDQNLLLGGTDEDKSDWSKKYLMARRLLHSQFLPLAGCLSIQVPNCEADDIIAFISTRLPDEKIIIYSSDRDLVQLCTDNISYYDGRDDITITKDSLIRDHELMESVWREHWLLTRAIAGDPSDNIPGFCTWTIAKRYSNQLMKLFMTKITLEDALMCLEKPSKTKIESYEKLRSRPDIVVRNFNLMDLHYPSNKKLPIFDDIRREIAGAFIYDIDQLTLETELHEMAMTRAKVYVSNIIESNMKNDVKKYIRKLV